METSTTTHKGFRWGESDAPEFADPIKPSPQIALESWLESTSNEAVDLQWAKQAYFERPGMTKVLKDELISRLDPRVGERERDFLALLDVKLPHKGVAESHIADSAAVSQSLQERFQVLQKWEGRVTEVDVEQGELTAILRDKTSPDSPEEEVILALDELAESDLRHLEVGSLFYWTIGHRFSASGRKTKESEIRLRRLRGFSKAFLERASEYAAEMAELFPPLEISMPTFELKHDSGLLTSDYKPLKTHDS